MNKISEQEQVDNNVEVFNNAFDKLTCDKDIYGDILTMLIAAINSKEIQSIINNKYLEYKGYNIKELEERGKNIFKGILVASIREQRPGEKRPLNARVMRIDNDQIDKMVDRFLSWEMPKNFQPDAGISFTRPSHIYSGIKDADKKLWPTGTNLFNADQTKEMIECLLSDD